MLDRLKNFYLPKWLHPAIALGVVLVVASLAIENFNLAAIGLGIAACGLGEHTLDGHSRFNRRIGFTLIGLGLIPIAVGLYGLVR